MRLALHLHGSLWIPCYICTTWTYMLFSVHSSCNQAEDYSNMHWLISTDRLHCWDGWDEQNNHVSANIANEQAINKQSRKYSFNCRFVPWALLHSWVDPSWVQMWEFGVPQGITLGKNRQILKALFRQKIVWLQNTHTKRETL